MVSEAVYEDQVKLSIVDDSLAVKEYRKYTEEPKLNYWCVTKILLATNISFLYCLSVIDNAINLYAYVYIAVQKNKLLLYQSFCNNLIINGKLIESFTLGK